ncbi:hypothetical protein AGR1A_pAt10041 [Agrobacterium fabacearum CFBP 5771]|nr:hypothetical protein AGR1A_pAt10041 [Agrobacterium fabacearum CFBP 5771]
MGWPTMCAEHMSGSVKLFSRLNIFEEIGVRYGVRNLWPVLWLQHRLLKRSLAFLDDRAKLSLMRWRPSSTMHCARILARRQVYHRSLTAP